MADRTPVPRWRRTPGTRRDDLVAAALSVMREKGFAAMTTADVAAAAGVGKGTLYRYFASKDDLLGAVKAGFVDELAARLEAVHGAAPERGWDAALGDAVTTVVDYVFERRAVVEVLVTTTVSEEARAQAAPAMARLHRAVVALLAGGARAGAFEVADPQATALLLERALWGAAEHAVLSRARVSRRRLVAAAEALVRGGLLGGRRR